MRAQSEVIQSLKTNVYTIPTDGPEGKESDGTLEWNATTMIVVEIEAGNQTGVGYTYGEAATAVLIETKLKPLVIGKNPFEVSIIWKQMMEQIRNSGQQGIGALAVSAIDIACWDLKAKLLELPLYQLLGHFHSRLPVYASGGFCNYSLERLANQTGEWVDHGIQSIKIKTSRFPEQDVQRLSVVRKTIGDRAELMVDANGALSPKTALYWAHRFRNDWGVTWFEEPVSSFNRNGLRLIKEQGPPGLEVAAGEYGFVARDFVDLIEANSIDCLQADVTRCCGITGLLQVAGLAAAHSLKLSAHCAPAVSLHAFCAVQHFKHLEYFHDHVRIESRFFDDFPSQSKGMMSPIPDKPGLGIELKKQEMEEYRVM